MSDKFEKATPRPWGATTRLGSWDWVIYSEEDSNIEICQPFHDGTDDNEVGEDNARLIVAAVNERDALREALRQLLHEVIEAGFGTARDYNWPKAIADARKLLEDDNG